MKSTLIFILTLLISASYADSGQSAQESFDYIIETDGSTIDLSNGQATIAQGELNLVPGAPSIGYKIVKIVLPPETDVDGITVELGLPQSIGQGYNIDYVKGDQRTDLDGPDTADAPDMQIYGKDEIYPNTRVEILSSGYWGDIHLASIAVYPVAFKPLSREIIFYPRIMVHFNLSPRTSGNNLRLASDRFAYKEVSNLIDNKADLPMFTSLPPMGKVGFATDINVPQFLIITSAAIAPGFGPYIEWKNQKGLPANLVFIEDVLGTSSGRDNAERLRNYLIQAYNNGVRWVILGGDEDVIPIRYLYPGNISNSIPALGSQQVGDIYYSDLTGDWDFDNDGVWGESIQDHPDYYPEIYVGRVPARTADQALLWTTKAVNYEKNPGNGDPSYLTKALFICADEMRDFNQHVVLSALMPSNFNVNATSLIEQPTGGSSAPTGPSAVDVINLMNEGWGFISNLNHGAISFYVVRSVGFNRSDRSRVWGDTLYYADELGFNHLTTVDKPAIHYSISCDVAAYDFDKGIFNPGPWITSYCLAESYVLQPGGGVAFLGNTRWGWVSSSYRLESKFIQYILQDSTSRLAVAEALSKIDNPSYRDINYGHNLFGDPEMSMWLSIEGNLSITGPSHINDNETQTISYQVSDSNGPSAGANVCLYMSGDIFQTGVTDNSGNIEFTVTPLGSGRMTVTATKPRYIPGQNLVTVGSLSGTNEDLPLPAYPTISQNFPNPFNPSTTIDFQMPSAGKAEITVFDIAGRIVKNLVSGQFPAGANRIVWNGDNEYGNKVSSGLYFYRFNSGPTKIVKQMVMIK